MNKLYKRLVSLVTLGVLSILVLSGCTVTIAKPAVRKCNITINSVGNGIDVNGEKLEERSHSVTEVVTDGDSFREDLEGHLLLNNNTENYPVVLEIIHVGEDSVRFKEGEVVSEISYDKSASLYSSIKTDDWYNYDYTIIFDENVVE